MDFHRGDRVEVLNKEEGFKGSYFSASIISQISNNEYIVQYRTLIEDDGSGPLREVLPADKLRRQPPEIVTAGFSLGDVVDVYDRDGWWVGEIIKVMGSKYLVHFESSDEEIVYSFSMLRLHQEWMNGVWISAKK